MIYLTGDTHSDFRRFTSANFPEQKEMGKEDYVIVCGDFGGLWDGSKEEKHWLDWLDAKPFTTLFVSGNHENYDLLDALPAESWNGGLVQRIRPSVLHLMRGQLFTIDGLRVFTMGGASSHDISDGILDPKAPDFRALKKKLDARHALYRIDHVSWWKRELPDEEEYAQAERTLDSCGREVDLILSHCAPTTIAARVTENAEPDRLTDYFESLSHNCRFRYWFFGHYHDNCVLDGKYVLLYEQIVALTLPGKTG